MGPEVWQVQRDGRAGAAPGDVPLPLGLAAHVPHRGQHQLAARGRRQPRVDAHLWYRVREAAYDSVLKLLVRVASLGSAREVPLGMTRQSLEGRRVGGAARHCQAEGGVGAAWAAHLHASAVAAAPASASAASATAATTVAAIAAAATAAAATATAAAAAAASDLRFQPGDLLLKLAKHGVLGMVVGG